MNANHIPMEQHLHLQLAPKRREQVSYLIYIEIDFVVTDLGERGISLTNITYATASLT